MIGIALKIVAIGFILWAIFVAAAAVSEMVASILSYPSNVYRYWVNGTWRENLKPPFGVSRWNYLWLLFLLPTAFAILGAIVLSF